jgi:hypothetical protein
MCCYLSPRPMTCDAGESSCTLADPGLTSAVLQPTGSYASECTYLTADPQPRQSRRRRSPPSAHLASGRRGVTFEARESRRWKLLCFFDSSSQPLVPVARVAHKTVDPASALPTQPGRQGGYCLPRTCVPAPWQNWPQRPGRRSRRSASNVDRLRWGGVVWCGPQSVRCHQFRVSRRRCPRCAVRGAVAGVRARGHCVPRSASRSGAPR